MTAPALPTTSSTTSPAVGLLRLDGVLCAAMGLTLAIGAEPVAELLGTASTGVLRVVGVALVLYGLDRWGGWALPRKEGSIAIRLVRSGCRWTGNGSSAKAAASVARVGRRSAPGPSRRTVTAALWHRPGPRTSLSACPGADPAAVRSA